jgi:hypothetical protein
MVDPILSKRRVDPDEVDRLREYFDSLDDRRAAFERGLNIENVHTEAAFLQEEDGEPVLYYYMERGEEYPPDVDREDIDDPAVLELSRDHAELLNDVCTEPARDDDGSLRGLETLFFASTVEREE